MIVQGDVCSPVSVLDTAFVLLLLNSLCACKILPFHQYVIRKIGCLLLMHGLQINSCAQPAHLVYQVWGHRNFSVALMESRPSFRVLASIFRMNKCPAIVGSDWLNERHTWNILTLNLSTADLQLSSLIRPGYNCLDSCGGRCCMRIHEVTKHRWFLKAVLLTSHNEPGSSLSSCNILV